MSACFLDPFWVRFGAITPAKNPNSEVKTHSCISCEDCCRGTSLRISTILEFSVSGSVFVPLCHLVFWSTAGSASMYTDTFSLSLYFLLVGSFWHRFYLVPVRGSRLRSTAPRVLSPFAVTAIDYSSRQAQEGPKQAQRRPQQAQPRARAVQTHSCISCKDCCRGTSLRISMKLAMSLSVLCSL